MRIDGEIGKKQSAAEPGAGGVASCSCFFPTSSPYSLLSLLLFWTGKRRSGLQVGTAYSYLERVYALSLCKTVPCRVNEESLGTWVEIERDKEPGRVSPGKILAIVSLSPPRCIAWAQVGRLTRVSGWVGAEPGASVSRLALAMCAGGCRGHRCNRCQSGDGLAGRARG